MTMTSEDGKLFAQRDVVIILFKNKILIIIRIIVIIKQ